MIQGRPLIVIGLALAAALAGCGGSPSAASLQPTINPRIAEGFPFSERTFRMGTAGFVPANYPSPSDADWQNFFQGGAAAYGELYGVHIVPGEQLNEAGVPQQVQLGFENVEGVEVYVALGANHEHGPFTVEKGEQLVEAAIATARAYRPEFLSLGVESNSFYLFQPETYPLYVEYVRQAYSEIKRVSPNTQVMNNFQLDRMRGATRLTGQEFAPHWELIDELEGAIDMLSFTVYPFLHYEKVDEIPPDYLHEIRQHTGLPVMITETGWPSETTPSGVPGSHQAQIDYVIWLAESANEIDMRAIIWVFPHDAAFQVGGGIFDSISLRENDGTPKPAFEYWQALQALPLASPSN